jgi:hypothetical protein
MLLLPYAAFGSVIVTAHVLRYTYVSGRTPWCICADKSSLDFFERVGFASLFNFFLGLRFFRRAVFLGALVTWILDDLPRKFATEAPWPRVMRSV